MSLEAGSVLGPYEIVSLIGAGGMGEVYRARDKRLERTVAIKLLPAALSANGDLRQRLEREARTISSLAHSHICTLFDVGEAPDGSTFLVMEHLEGESLASRLARGPLPLKQALRAGAEIADALDAAHRQGIVHRDLKPGNVMLTKSGVKLLDFGLAKLVTNSGVFASDPNSPTIQQQNDITAAGLIVGTLQYMSPEQLEGKVADARADIFALGATLYEMLTGQRAFQAGSRAALIARILGDEPPPLTAAAPSVPASVARLVEHCLMKDPDERWQTARDVAIQLRGAAEGSGSEVIAAPRAKSSWPWIAAGLLVAAIATTAALMWPRKSAPPAGFTHLSIDLSPDDDRLALMQESVIAVSPDGSKIAFAGSGGNETPMLYLRRSDSFAVEPVAGSERPTSAFFSPDGKELAFISSGNLKRLTLGGGTSEVVAVSGPSQSGSWGSDGIIYFNPAPGGHVHRVAAAGGNPVPVAAKGIRGGLVLPEYVAERKLLLGVQEVQGRSFDDAEIVAVSTKTNEAKVVARGTTPRYIAASDTLLFAREGKVWRVGFDPKRLSVRGTPEPLAEPVLIHPGTGMAAYDVTEAGDVVYAPFAEERYNMRLMLVGRDGKTEPLPFPPGRYHTPTLSADGRMLGLEIVGANNDVWIGDMQRGTLNRVTSTIENLAPILSPDGRRVLVSRHETGNPALALVRADGVGDPRPVAPSTLPRFAWSWSADGMQAAFVEFHAPGSDVHLLRFDAAGAATVVPLLRSRFDETEPDLSPDGRWIAYTSNETGKAEVYIRSVAEEGTKLRISMDGGNEPLWANSGRELFYRRGDALLSVSVTLSPSLTASPPKQLFEFPGTVRDISRSYDITPDDTRFVMIERSARAGTMRTLHVVRGVAGGAR